MEIQNPRVPPLWEYSLTILLGCDSTSDIGIALRQWVCFQGVNSILDLLSWDQEKLKIIPAQQMTMVKVCTLGPTKSNNYVGS